MGGASPSVSELAQQSGQDTEYISDILRNEDDHLSRHPPIAYLNSDEQVKFAFYNKTKGIGVGSKYNLQQPTATGGTVILFTNLRVVVLIGRSDDELASIPYAAIDDIEYSFGRLKHRISHSTPGARFHLWIRNSASQADIEDAVAVSESIGDDSSPDNVEFTALQPIDDITDDLLGHAEAQDATNPVEQSPASTAGPEEVSTKADGEPVFVDSSDISPGEPNETQLRQLLRTHHVTESWVAESQSNSGCVHVPPLYYIHPRETVFYTISNRKKGVAKGKRTNTTTPSRNGLTLGIFTDTRVIFAVPQNDQDALFEIPYSQITEVNTKSGFRKKRITFSSTADDYHMWVGKSTDVDRIASAVEYLQSARTTAADTLSVEEPRLRYNPDQGVLFDIEQPGYTAQPNALNRFIDRTVPPALHPANEFLLTDVTGSAAVHGKLKILDRDTGKGTIESKGWQVGMRTKSTSKFEKEGYEVPLFRFIINEGSISITAHDPDAGSGWDARQEIQRTFDQIIGVDYNKRSGDRGITNLGEQSGITLHTKTNIYRIEFTESDDTATTTADLIETLREMIQRHPQEGRSRNKDQAAEPASASKLRELAELKEDGVISESEFQEKKAEFLDDF